LERFGQKYQGKDGSVKIHIDVRLVNVPPLADILCRKIRDIKHHQLGKLIIIFGTVVRSGNVNSREVKKKFRCKQCEYEVIADSDITECN